MPAAANTLYLNGTEYCEIAKDSAALLAKRAKAAGVSVQAYLTQNCHVETGGLPRKGMEDSLVAAAKDCAAVVGEERWAELKSRWKTVASANSAFDLRTPDEDPLVGAFCEAVKNSKPGEPITFLHFAHGRSKKTAGLDSKTGEFSMAELQYPGATLWALTSLAPKDKRVVTLHENCYGESLMSDMMFGPRQDFAAYRPGTCGLAGASHDRLLTFETNYVRRARVYDNGAGCAFESVPSGAKGTFMRNLERLPAMSPHSVSTFSRAVIANPGKTLNMPVTGSISLLGLYHDRFSKEESGGVSLTSCVFEPKSALPELLAAGASTLFFDETARIRSDYLKGARKFLAAKGNAPRDLEIINAELSALESESPPGPLVGAFTAMNDAVAELDDRNRDFDRFCAASIRPPACKVNEAACTVRHLRESCALESDQPLSLAFKSACANAKGNDKFADSVSLLKLLPQKSCRSRTLDCLTQADLKKEITTRVGAWDKVNTRIEGLRYLRRLGKSINGLDMIARDLSASDASRAASARSAMQAYLGMLECERKGVFK